MQDLLWHLTSAYMKCVYERAYATSKPNFLGWIVYQIFLPMVLRRARFARGSSANNNSNNNNNNNKSRRWKKHSTILNSIDIIRPANDTRLLSRNWEISCLKGRSYYKWDVRPKFGQISTQTSTKKSIKHRESTAGYEKGSFRYFVANRFHAMQCFFTHCLRNDPKMSAIAE